MKRLINDWRFVAIAALTLGLAPFVPEPHIFGKVRWVWGGAAGMQPMDWFDLALHGTPWLLLFRLGALRLFNALKPSGNKPTRKLPTYITILTGSVIMLLATSCAQEGRQRADNTRSIHAAWGYTGETSPEHWAEITPDFIKCAEGHLQSPIDIETYKTNTIDGDIVFDYHTCPVDLVNNGHTVQAIPEAENFLRVLGKRYKLLQIHFHDPSEHHIDGIIYPMEIHFVHADSAANLAVLGVMVKEGPDNTLLSDMWAGLPTHTDEHYHPKDSLHMSELLPVHRTIFHYVGSLTTPPCTEGVDWLILSEPIVMSKSQIRRFQTIHPNNGRPIQEIDSHKVEVMPT